MNTEDTGLAELLVSLIELILGTGGKPPVTPPNSPIQVQYIAHHRRRV